MASRCRSSTRFVVFALRDALHIGWAFADARTPLTDPFDHHRPEPFAEGVSVVDRLCDRLETVYESVREHNRTRHLLRADWDGDSEQPGLEAFGETA